MCLAYNYATAMCLFYHQYENVMFIDERIIPCYKEIKLSHLLCLMMSFMLSTYVCQLVGCVLVVSDPASFGMHARCNMLFVCLFVRLFVRSFFVHSLVRSFVR